MNRKRSVAVVFGGRSAEHEVSIMSATNVMQAIDRSKYDVVPIRIERDGRWLLHRPGPPDGRSAHQDMDTEVTLLPGREGRLVAASPLPGAPPLPEIDIIFPVLHGPYGEDGAVQGFAETAGIPFVGCSVASSAICMDKDLAKRLLAAAGIPVARSLTARRDAPVDFATAEGELGMPIFVKPARQGSSFGVSKADSAATFEAALANAFAHDDKLLVEEFVTAREIECAVLEKPDGSLVVSAPGEIITAASHEFYTYEAKYLDTGGTVVVTPADVPDAVKAVCRETAKTAFVALECSGMARIDFFLRQDGQILLNEINTIPGFTNMSMYPKALATEGISYPQAVETLIETAMARRRPAGSQPPL